MANARAYPSPAIIRKMVELARDLGLDPGGFEVTTDGAVRVLPKPVAPVTQVDEWLGKM